VKDIPKKLSRYPCPICGKLLTVTYWGIVNLANPKSDNLWRFCCKSILITSFGEYHCYFNSPIVQLPRNYRDKIDWGKIKSLTDSIHPVIKNAIDEAIKHNKFAN